MVNIDILKQRLQHNIVTISYFQSGLVETIYCSLSPQHIPAFESSRQLLLEDSNTLRVWDVKSDRWITLEANNIRGVI